MLEFVEGPLWLFASAVFVLGVVWRLLRIFLADSRADIAPSRRSGTFGALRTIVSRSWSAPGFSKGATFHLVAGYMFHIGLFVLVLFAAPHVEFIEQRLLGFAWPAAPHWVFILSAELAFAGLLLLWLRRVLHPVMKQISTWDDHAAAILICLAMLTGCLALLRSHDSLRLLHMVTVELLMI